MPIQLKEKNNQFYLQSRLLCGLRDRRSSGCFINHSDRPLGTELLENERRMEDDKMRCKLGIRLFLLVQLIGAWCWDFHWEIFVIYINSEMQPPRLKSVPLQHVAARCLDSFLLFAGKALCANGIGSIVVLGMGSSIILRLGPTYALALSFLVNSFRLAAFHTAQ